MRAALVRRLLPLLLVATFATPTVPITHAQDGTPVTPPSATGTPMTGRVLEPAVRDNAAAPSTLVVPAANTATPAPTATTSDTPLLAAPTVTTGAQTRNIQGAIKLDLSSPTGVTAGNYILYTYGYTNTTGTATAPLIVEAWWNDFSVNQGDRQFCYATGADSCDVIAGSGPTVTKLSQCPVPTSLHYCYQIASLLPGATGRFSIQLKTRADIFPRTNAAITSLSGSSKIYLASTPSTIISDDTASSIVVGPVLNVRKSAVTQGSIYTNGNGTFNIAVGNATGDGDKSGTTIRADARTAQNIVLIDIPPAGSTFVSATNGGAYDSTKKEVRWNLPGPILPGAKIDVQVTYQKTGGDPGSCRTLDNNTLRASSDGYPLDDNGNRFFIGGDGAAIPVVVPVRVVNLVATPNVVFFGDQGKLEIEVDNFWDKAITGLTLTYAIQSNMSYAGGANPPAASMSASQVQWNFDMPAGTKDAPTVKKFTLNLLAGFTRDILDGTGIITVTTPTGVPNDCSSVNVRVGTAERINVRKYSQESTAPVVKKSDTLYLVPYNYNFEYTIEIGNQGSTTANNVEVTDLFPNQTGANFTLSVGPTVTPPTGSGGPIAGGYRWTGMTVPPGQKIIIRYKLNVQGQDYREYCNSMSGLVRSTPTNETVENRGNYVCVKISPQIALTKKVDKTSIALLPAGNTPSGQRTVKFTMSITNHEPTSYSVGLYDQLAGEFEYIGPVTSEPSQVPPGSPTYNSNNRVLEWPVQDLAPNQTITVAFTALVIDQCVNRTYRNSIWFRNGQQNVIVPDPEVTALVQVTCGQVEYSIGGDRNLVSLKDKLIYTVNLNNVATQDSPTLQAEVRLPEKFAYVAMAANSAVTTAPTQSTAGGYTTLIWNNVPSIRAQTQIQIRFQAISGDTILSGLTANEAAWTRLKDNGKCVNECTSDPLGGTLYSVSRIKVDPLATLETSIAETSCAKPGDIRTYKVSVVNRNVHAYASTNITVTLPLGLTYVKTLTGTATPSVIKNGNLQTLVWPNQQIPAPSGSSFAQKDYQVQLQVGNVIGALRATAQATSPDGLIPQKEGVVDPTVYVCLTEPAAALTVNNNMVKPGALVTFEVFLANPKSTAFTVALEHQIPTGMTFAAFVGPNGLAPQQVGGKLSWASIVVPGGTTSAAGQVTITYIARVSATAKLGTAYTNTLLVKSQSPTTPLFDVTRTTVVVRVARDLYLPLASSNAH